MVVVIQECLTSLLLFHRLVDQAGTSISAAAAERPPRTVTVVTLELEQLTGYTDAN